MPAFLSAFGGRRADAEATLRALSRAQAMIEFALDGTVLTANDTFLATMGYSLDEVVGRHHRIFVEPAYAQSPDYAEFWRRLAAGEFVRDEFHRLAKGGRDVWLQAAYAPVLDRAGRPARIVKLASDVTAQKVAAADAHSQLAAIGRTQGASSSSRSTVPSSPPTKISARALGYGLDEIVSRHHRMFVDPAYAQSAEYQEFWERLRRGEAGRQIPPPRQGWARFMDPGLLQSRLRPVREALQGGEVRHRRDRATAARSP